MTAVDSDKLGEFLKQTGGMVTAGFNCAISVLIAWGCLRPFMK